MHRFGLLAARARALYACRRKRFPNLARVLRTHVGSVERGEQNVELDNINAFAAALGVSPARLVDD